MVFSCGLKMATGCVGSGASWEGLLCRPRSAAICAQLEAVWWELQIDLQFDAASVGLGGTLERLYCELRLATTCTGFVEHSTLLKLCSKPTLAAAFVGLEAT